MSGEVIQFLNTKFVKSLPGEDASTDQNWVPLKNTFKGLKSVLQKKLAQSMDNPTRDELMDCLYRLNFALSRYQRIQEKRKKRKISHFTIGELYLLFKMQRELSRIKQKIQNHREDSKTGSGANGSRSNNLRKSAHVFGFEDKKEAIVESLKKENNDGINVVGIVGMCGTGKSTLVQLVYDDDRVKMEFMPRIWVTLSKQESTTNIVRYLLNELGEDSDDDDNHTDGEIHDEDDDMGNGRQRQEDGRDGAKKEEERVKMEETRTLLLAALYKQLSGKKYLIVFDDAWHINSWYKHLLNDPKQSNEHLGLPKGHGGGIIVTSRLDDDVRSTTEEAKTVGKPDLHRISATLDQGDCWSIFIQTVEANGISSDHHILATMKEEIINNCKGLPLAAETLGNIISEKIAGEVRTSQDITTSNG